MKSILGSIALEEQLRVYMDWREGRAPPLPLTAPGALAEITGTWKTGATLYNLKTEVIQSYTQHYTISFQLLFTSLNAARNSFVTGNNPKHDYKTQLHTANGISIQSRVASNNKKYFLRMGQWLPSSWIRLAPETIHSFHLPSPSTSTSTEFPRTGEFSITGSPFW